MAKKNVTKVVKLQIPAGKATPAPPVGTVLGPAGINLQEFCTVHVFKVLPSKATEFYR